MLRDTIHEEVKPLNETSDLKINNMNFYKSKKSIIGSLHLRNSAGSIATTAMSAEVVHFTNCQYIYDCMIKRTPT